MLRMYREETLRELYLAVGMGYFIGNTIGVFKGILDSLRNSRGKFNGMVYMVKDQSEEIGMRMSMAVCAGYVARALLKKGSQRIKGLIE